MGEVSKSQVVLVVRVATALRSSVYSTLNCYLHGLSAVPLAEVQCCLILNNHYITELLVVSNIEETVHFLLALQRKHTDLKE